MLFITHKVGLLQWQQMGAAKSCTWLRASCYIHSSRGRSYLIGEEAAFSGGLEQDVLQLGYRSRCPQEQQKTSLGTALWLLTRQPSVFYGTWRGHVLNEPHFP